MKYRPKETSVLWKDSGYGMRLPFQTRMAWALSFVEEAVGDYSSYFARKFCQFDAVELGWRAALGEKGEELESEVRELAHGIDELYAVGECEGYGIECIAMGHPILFEIIQDDGNAAVAAVEYAAVAIVNSFCYRKGTNITNPAIDMSLYEFARTRLLPVAESAFKWAEENKQAIVTRDMFAEFRFLPLQLQLDIEQSQTYPPPAHEVKSE